MNNPQTKRCMGNCSKCGKPLTEADREQVERTMFFAHNECRADYVAPVKSFSIFDQQGYGVEGQTFPTSDAARAFMDATDWVTEYGPVHIGELCETHDEGEKGNCPFCQHPQTDEHLAGCASCMMAHDKALPDSPSIVRIPDPGTLPHLFPNVKPVAADLVKAAAGDMCKGCGRDSIACSVDPCAAVIADRGEGLPPDPEGTNDESAKQAKDTLIHFEEAHGEAPYGGISEAQLLDLHRQNIVDLLANLGHYCDREGLDMQDIMKSAANRYDAETGNEGTQFNGWMVR
jgi:hypothetical protein